MNIKRKLSNFQSLRAEIIRKVQTVDVEMLQAMTYDGPSISKTHDINQKMQDQIVNKVVMESEIQEELRPKVNRALKMLGILSCVDEKYRHAIILVYFEGLGKVEVGKRLGVTRKTVDNWINEGVKQLRQYKFDEI